MEVSSKIRNLTSNDVLLLDNLMVGGSYRECECCSDRMSCAVKVACTVWSGGKLGNIRHGKVIYRYII